MCSNGEQRYRCKVCNKSFKNNYIYCAYAENIDTQLVIFIKEGLGIRSISRILGISKTTVSKRILQIASNIQKPMVPMGGTYELDELCTYISNKKKRTWVAYALSRKTKVIVDLTIIFFGNSFSVSMNFWAYMMQLMNETFVWSEAHQRFHLWRFLFHSPV